MWPNTSRIAELRLTRLRGIGEGFNARVVGLTPATLLPLCLKAPASNAHGFDRRLEVKARVGTIALCLMVWSIRRSPLPIRNV
jgi:hypothetical protein